MSGKVQLTRSTTVLLRGAPLCNHANDSAESVLLVLAPKAMQSERVRIRLEEEDVQTAGDLQELDKEDLKELGLNMVERRRVLRWASSPSPIDFLESLQPPDERRSAEGRPLQAVEQ
ncbi:rev1, partial [Symbiodinium pilosum]